jgi:hypothetical protein
MRSAPGNPPAARGGPAQELAWEWKALARPWLPLLAWRVGAAQAVWLAGQRARNEGGERGGQAPELRWSPSPRSSRSSRSPC